MQPEIDFRRIDFPSDRLTIKNFREIHPESFDIPTTSPLKFNEAYGRGTLNYAIGKLIDAERCLASRAFKERLNISLSDEDNVFDSKDHVVDYLKKIYSEFTFGPQVIAHFISEIESQALSQAQQFLGPAK